MIPALEVRGLAKRYVIGVANCLATVEVLRNIDLSVRAGDAIAVVGPRGAGKSTLFLCLAGLLTPDAGVIRWFGESSRGTGLQRVVYHVTRTDLMRAGRIDAPNVHLVDLGVSASLGDLERWIDVRRHAGDAVVVATRDRDWVDGIASRVVRLEHGTLRAMGAIGSRVAEPVPT